MRRVLLFLAVLVLLGGAGKWAYEYYWVDACLDSVGYWDRSDMLCIRGAR